MLKKSWILYSLYAVVVGVLCVYILFPNNILKSVILAEAGKFSPDVQLGFEKAGLIFPPGVRLSKVQIDRDTEPLLFADDMTIVPKLRSLLGSKKKYTFRMQLRGGAIAGTAQVSDRRQVTIDATASELNIGDVAFLRNLTLNQVDGVLNGNFSGVARNGKLEALNTSLDIDNMGITLATPFFSLRELQFRKVHADAVLQNRQLEITRVTLSGDQIEGKLAGSAALNNDFKKSTVSLTGTVVPREQFLAGSGLQLPPNFLNGLKSGGGIPIRISGPLNDLRLGTR